MNSNHEKISQLLNVLFENENNFSESNSSEIIDAMLKIYELDPENGPLVLWSNFHESDCSFYIRTLAYTIAQSTEELNFLWIPINSFIEKPFLEDQSSLINCLTIIQRALINERELFLKFTQSELGDFFIFCLKREEIVSTAAIDVLVSIHETIHLNNYFDEFICNKMKQVLESLDKESYEVFEEDIELLIESVNSNNSPIEYPILDLLKKEFKKATNERRDIVLYEKTYEKIFNFLNEKIRLYKLKTAAIKNKRIMQDLRIMGRQIREGTISLDFYADFLKYWEKFFLLLIKMSSKHFKMIADIPSNIDENINLFVSSTSPGSFSTQIIFKGGEEKLEFKAFDYLELLVEGDLTKFFGITELNIFREDLSLKYLELLRLLNRHSMDIQISMFRSIDASLSKINLRKSVTSKLLGKVKEFRKLKTEDIQFCDVEGRLDTASCTNGKFEILLIGSGKTINGYTKPNKKSILIGKEIGRGYSFSLLQKIKRAEEGIIDQEEWILEEISNLVEDKQGKKEFDKTNLKEMESKEPNKNSLNTKLVPQANSLDKIIKLVELLILKKPLNRETLEISNRQISYYKHAAELLSLIKKNEEVSPEGKHLINLESGKQKDIFLLEQFSKSECGISWQKWSNVDSIKKINPEKAYDFLREVYNLKESLVKRRGDTLKAWYKKLISDEPSEEH